MQDRTKLQGKDKNLLSQAAQSVVQDAVLRDVAKKMVNGESIGPAKDTSYKGPMFSQSKSKEEIEREKEEKEMSDHEEDDPLFDDDEDLEFARLRQARLEQMKRAHDKKAEWKAKGHGEYTEIKQDEFLKSVTGSERAVVHFYHRDFERCKIVDMHLSKLAKKHLETRFLKIDADKAPFFVEKLGIRTLPCIPMFIDGVNNDRIVGFLELGDTDEFPTSLIEMRLAKGEVIHYEGPNVYDE